MALESHSGGSAGNNPGSLGHNTSIESELVQRNREIAKVRDLLRQREHEIDDWKSRHSELVGRLSDVGGELTKTKAQHKKNSLVAPSPAPNIVAEANALRAEVAERKQLMENLTAEHSMELERLRNELEAERINAKVARDREQEALRELADGRRERNRSVEAASQSLAKHDLESSRQAAELTAAIAEMSRLTKELQETRNELIETRRARDRSAERASERTAEHDVVIARQGDELAAVRAQASRLTKELEVARGETMDALQRVTTAQSDMASFHSRHDCDLQTARETARVAINRAEESEERLAAERHAIAGQLRALEEQLSCERRARREAEEGRVVLTTDLKEVMEGLAAMTGKFEASDATSVARSQEIDRLRLELGRLAERSVSLEEQLRSSSQFESRARALQTENSGLRSEVKLLRRQCQELHEGFAMVAEEARTQKVEAAGENAKLRLQLEEARRARSIEMHALVTKMCAVGATGGSKDEALAVF